VILVACALLFAPCATAATPPQDVRVRRTTGSLLRELRDGESFVERGETAEALIAKGREAQKRLAKQVAAELVELEERHQELRARRRARGAELVRGWGGEELAPEAVAEVARARAEVMRVSWEPAGRTGVQGELDRALGLLSFHLEAGFDQQLAADPEYAQASAELEQLAELGAELRRYFDRAAAVVQTGGRDAAWLRRLDPPPDPARWRAGLRQDKSDVRRGAWRIDDRARAVLAANREAEAELAPEERTAVRGVNRVRYLVGLPLLELDARLTRACLNHARDMLEHGFHDHVSPVKGRETFMMRAEEEGTSARNENLNQGAPDGEAAVLSWWQSYGHRKALLGPYGAIGMTHRAPHWVSLFR